MHYLTQRKQQKNEKQTIQLNFRRHTLLLICCRTAARTDVLKTGTESLSHFNVYHAVVCTIIPTPLKLAFFSTRLFLVCKSGNAFAVLAQGETNCLILISITPPSIPSTSRIKRDLMPDASN